MPPVTPSAINMAISGDGVIESLDRRTLLLDDLLYGLRHDFLLRDGRLLVHADLHSGRGAREQLARARAGGDDEFERVRELAAVNHSGSFCGRPRRAARPELRVPCGLRYTNVLTMVSASARIRCSRARSAVKIPCNRSAAASSSSLTTTKSYSLNAATSSRATCRRRWIASSLSLLRRRSRSSRTANDGGRTNTDASTSPRFLTHRVPCTSMTRTTSTPDSSSFSVSDFRVP